MRRRRRCEVVDDRGGNETERTLAYRRPWRSARYDDARDHSARIRASVYNYLLPAVTPAVSSIVDGSCWPSHGVLALVAFLITPLLSTLAWPTFSTPLCIRSMLIIDVFTSSSQPSPRQRLPAPHLEAFPRPGTSRPELPARVEGSAASPTSARQPSQNLLTRKPPLLPSQPSSRVKGHFDLLGFINQGIGPSYTHAVG